jgi:uncharacterized protein YhaN
LREDYWDDDGYGHETKEYEDTMVALDKAIASLEAWDKVTDELEEYKITGSQMECFGTTEENAKEYIPIDTALEIINKHLKEIEE